MTMPAITLHQPWATLVALGVKRYETRSWRPPAKYVGHRIAIHAGRDARACWDWDPKRISRPVLTDLGRAAGAQIKPPSRARYYSGKNGYRAAPTVDLPVGAVVCTAILGGPIMCGTADDLKHDHGPIIAAPWTHPGLMLYPADLMADAVEITDEAPYGDFSPGRWAWPLTDIETWIWCPGNGLAPCYDGKIGHSLPVGAPESVLNCRRCAGKGRLDLPIPAVGHQRVWQWTP